MQPTQDRLGVDGVRFSAAMARIGLWGLDMGERRIGETGTERHVRTAKIVVGNHDFKMHHKCDSDKGISQSRHSRRMVPMTRSQTALALGLWGGDFNTVTPSFPIDSSRCWAKILSRS